MKTLVFQTKGGNVYLYSSFKREIILINPELLYLLRKNEKIIVDKTISTEGIKKLTKSEQDALFKTYKFLEASGYFKRMEAKKFLAGRISPSDIEKKLQNFPTILFEVTDDCNLQCEYCAYGDFYEGYDKRGTKTLSLELAFSCIKYIENAIKSNPEHPGINGMTVGFYGGEPMLNMTFIKKIVQYVNKLKAKDFKVFYWITTNGTLLENNFDFLIENDFRISVSIDGNEYSNSYRLDKKGKESFTRVFSNLLKLKEYNQDYFNNLQILTVIHDKTSIDETTNFFRSHLGKTPVLLMMRDSEINPRKKDEFKKFYFNYNGYLAQRLNADPHIKNEENFEKALSSIRSTMKWVHANKYRTYNELLNHYYHKIQVPTATCLPFERKFFVTTNGRILQCERAYNLNQLGYVDKDGVHLDFAKIADDINGKFDKIQKQCNSCYAAMSCPQCIYWADIQKDKIICDRKKTAKKYIEKLSIGFSRIEANKRLYERLLSNSEAS